MAKREYLNDKNLKNYDKYLLLVDEGLTNKEIAEILKVSLRTVQRYRYGSSGKYPLFEMWEGNPLETNKMNVEELVEMKEIVEKADLKYTEKFGVARPSDKSKIFNEYSSLDEMKNLAFYYNSGPEHHKELDMAIKYGLPYSNMHLVSIIINHSKDELIEINNNLLNEISSQVKKLNKFIEHLEKGNDVDIDEIKPSDELQLLTEILDKNRFS